MHFTVNYFIGRIRLDSMICGLLLLVSALISANSVSAKEGAAAIIITNEKELVDAAPDSELVIDVFKSLDETELARLAWRDDHKIPSAAELTLALISLGAPGNVNSVARYNEAYAVSPVKDFDRFIKAIDYGRVVSRDDKNQIARVRIDPAEIQLERLIQRAQVTGKRPSAFSNLLRSRSNSQLNRPAKRLDGMPSQIADRSKQSGSSLINSDASAFQIGQQVEIDLANKAFDGTVISIEDEVRIELADYLSLSDSLPNRRLKTRLKRAEGFSFLAPPDRLRLIGNSTNENLVDSATINPQIQIEQRIWNDNTGQHQIIGTFAGRTKDKVRLTKTNGDEIVVPLTRLSKADNEYVKQLAAENKNKTDNPFAVSAEPQASNPPPQSPRELKSSYNHLRTIQGKNFSRWKFNPPSEQHSDVVTVSTNSLELTAIPNPGPFGEELSKLFISSNGSIAVALIDVSKGADKRQFLQWLDFAEGKSSQLIPLPDESALLDVLPEERLLLLRPDVHGIGKNSKLFVQKIANDQLTPVDSWTPATRDDFHKDIDEAMFLSGDRVMVHLKHGSWIIWDRKNAEALYEIPIKSHPRATLALDPSRRFLAFGTSAGISLLDTEEGRHVATIVHELDDPKAIALSADMTRLAVWGQNDVASWSLRDGRLIHQMAAPTKTWNKSLDWMDDLLLVGGSHLLDPQRRILLWQYQVASSRSQQHLAVRTNRLFYAPKSEKGLPLYVATIPAPHAAILEKRKSLGSAEELLIAEPGDKFRIEIDTDLNHNEEKHLLNAVSKNLIAAGYQVVDESDNEPLIARVYCKALESQNIRINMSSSPLPDPWDIVERKFKPYISGVVVNRDGVELWSNGWRAEPGHIIHLLPGEKIDQALSRLTSPDIKSLENLRFPSHLARPGTATPDGAYGMSRLTPKGVVSNKLGQN